NTRPVSLTLSPVLICRSLGPNEIVLAPRRNAPTVKAVRVRVEVTLKYIPTILSLSARDLFLSPLDIERDSSTSIEIVSGPKSDNERKCLQAPFPTHSISIFLIAFIAVLSPEILVGLC